MTSSHRVESRLAGAVLLVVGGATWAWTTQPSGTSSDLRGLCAVSDSVAWASGTGGTYLQTLDGGRSWRASRVPGADELDFRDVEAFDARTAVLMSAGEGSKSRVYRTDDSGSGWALTLENPDAKGFFDAISFWDRRSGLLLGDPVEGRFVLYSTTDAGRSWKRVDSRGLPPALPGEGAFAASGTCLATGPGGRAWFGTGGGGTARVFRSKDFGRTWTAATLPIPADNSSSGVFSVAFWDSLHGIAAGGDYKKPRGPSVSIALTDDGGATWTSVTLAAPFDRFFSAVAVAVVRSPSPPVLVATGSEVSAWSADGGRTWTGSEQGYNALAFSRRAGWAAGPGGRIGRFPDQILALRRRP